LELLISTLSGKASPSTVGEFNLIYNKVGLTSLAIVVVGGMALAQKPAGTPDVNDLETQLVKRVDAEKRTFHVLLISVSTRALALQIIKQLNDGADFATLAKKYSMEPSKMDGGDVGWFKASRVIAPIADTLAGLQKGEVTQTPVQTDYGWYVIKLLDKR
jgi:parvulin-like peptidyl-prolyl isomerase